SDASPHAYPTRRSSDLISGHLADLLLVEAGDGNNVLLDSGGNALGKRKIHLVAVAQAQLEPGAGHSDAETDAVDFQLLGKALCRSEEHTSELQSREKLV